MLDGEINIGLDHERDRRMGGERGRTSEDVYIVRGVGRQDNGHVALRTRLPLTAVHTIIRSVDGIWSTRSIPATDTSVTKVSGPPLDDRVPPRNIQLQFALFLRPRLLSALPPDVCVRGLSR